MTDADAPREDQDNVDAMFPSGAPGMGLGGVGLTRSTITFVSEDAESGQPGEPEPQKLTWHVSGFPVNDNDGGQYVPMILVGDLTCQDSDWFVGVTSTAQLTSKEPMIVDEEDVDEVNRLVGVYGLWAANVLYDVAAMRARMLIAGATSCDLDIPIVTPETHVLRLSRRDETTEIDSSAPVS